MSEPKFNNRENFLIKNEEGKEFWISRSMALVGVIMVITPDDGIQVLIEKRAKTLKVDGKDVPMVEGGKWCLPCGFLDWDESGYDGMVREIYEETGIYVPDFENFCVYDNNRKPFFVKTDPHEDRQNVSLSYVFVYDFEGVENKTFFQDIYHPRNEIDALRWVKIEDVFRGEVIVQKLKDEKVVWAFNHDERIKLAYFEYINS